MKTSAKQLNKLVIKEINNLIIHATKTERRRLNYKYFNPNHTTKCIYGQMTGSCDSERAKQLLNKCAVPVSTDIDKNIISIDKRYNKNFDKKGSYRSDVFSPIEVYVFRNRFNAEINDKIIKFIKTGVPIESLD